MSKWTEYFKRKKDKLMDQERTSAVTNVAPDNKISPTVIGTNIAGTIPTGNISSSTMTTYFPSEPSTWVTSIPSAVPAIGSYGTTNTSIVHYRGGFPFLGPAFTMTPSTSSKLIELRNHSGQILLCLNSDGSVLWANEIKVDEAAEAFARSLTVGVEIAAGINKNTKLKMRDSVFEDLISIAKDKGSLTADDLTYLLEASKIVEKLRNDKE